jgi:hypothetical protein
MGKTMPKLKLRISRSKKRSEDFPLSKGTERRKTPRVAFDTKARFRLPGNAFQEVMVQNISSGGMCLLLESKVSPTKIIELEFKLPGSGEEVIRTYAEVLWQSNSHTGIKFISM